MKLKRELGLRDLVLLNIVAIVGLRWISKAAAEGGVTSISLWLLAALFFFIPQGLTVMELTKISPSEGGIYQWAKLAFGDFHCFICGWCYWTNNLIYYPTLLMFMAGTSAYIMGDRLLFLETSNIYNMIFCLIILWILIILNILGMKTGKWVQNLGAFATWMPIIVIIGAGIAVTWSSGFSNPFTFKDTIPDFFDFKMIAFFSTMCFGFAGLEIGSLMADEIKDPEKNFPRAIIIGGILIAFIYIIGTLSLLAALPREEISVITGIVQTIATLETKWGLGGIITGIVAFFIVIGGMGGSSAWLAGAARIPFVAGLDNFLPSYFGKLHPRYHTPYVAIFFQGLFSSVFIIIAISGSTVKEAYNVLLDMTIIIYFIPYIYMFLSLIAIRRRKTYESSIIPAGMTGVWLVGLTGIAVTLLSIFLAFVPPEGTENIVIYEAKLIGGTLIFILIAAGLYYKNKWRKGSMRQEADRQKADR